MKKLVKRLVILGLLVGGGYLLWGQRDRVASIHNNKLRVQGTWFEYAMNRKGFEPYHFGDRIITFDGTEWGSYELPSNEVIEVMEGNRLTAYHLSFPREDHMVWSTEIKGELTAVRRWER